MSQRIIESYKQKLASEEGWIRKRGTQLRIALCYPNVYEIGMANLGFHAMYELFNRIPEVSCERVFLPDEREMREYERTRASLLSMESQTPVRDFDVVAFSISFETDYLNMVHMLRLSGVPVWSKDRNGRDPLVVMGGAARQRLPKLCEAKRSSRLRPLSLRRVRRWASAFLLRFRAAARKGVASAGRVLITGRRA